VRAQYANANRAARLVLDRAQAKREQIEHELRKSPDSQLYLVAKLRLVAKSRKDQARMECLPMEIPAFKLRHTLTNSNERASRVVVGIGPS
jgi:hypothetical protein